MQRTFIAILGALTFAVIGLAIYTTDQTIDWDMSQDGANWSFLYVRSGAVCYVYVGADAAPNLKAASPSRAYREYVAEYAKLALEKSLWAQEDSARKQSTESFGQHYVATLDPDSPVDAERIKAFREAQAERVKEVAKMHELRGKQLPVEKHDYRLFLTGKANRIGRAKSFLGFYLGVGSSPREVVLRVPLAAFILLIGLVPTLSFITWMRRRARRKRENLCLTCGYNLTGNTSGKCPECGTQVAGLFK